MSAAIDLTAQNSQSKTGATDRARNRTGDKAEPIKVMFSARINRIGFSKRTRTAFIPSVKKVKMQSTQRPRNRTRPKGPENRAPYQKAALRSEAFTRAIMDAKSYASDTKRLRTLFDEVSEKMASISKDPFKENWAYLQAMLRLVRAYSRSEYRAVSQDSLLSIVAALNYLIDPFDLIPDEVPFLGFIDDATVLSFAVRNSKDDLDDFMTWEMVAP